MDVEIKNNRTREHNRIQKPDLHRYCHWLYNITDITNLEEEGLTF